MFLLMLLSKSKFFTRVSATRVKNFDFDKSTSKNIFSHHYVSYMASESNGVALVLLVLFLYTRVTLVSFVSHLCHTCVALLLLLFHSCRTCLARVWHSCSGSRMFWYIILKSMLSDVLILVMWPNWVHKRLQEFPKYVFSGEKAYKDFLVLLTEFILH